MAYFFAKAGKILCLFSLLTVQLQVCFADKELSAGAKDAQVIAEPLNFPERELILLAVNDNPDSNTANGGCHWYVFKCAGPTPLCQCLNKCL